MPPKPVKEVPKVEEKKAPPKKEFLRKFDYKTLNLPNVWPIQDKEKILDQHGEEGWELVSVVGESFFLKRLLK